MQRWTLIFQLLMSFSKDGAWFTLCNSLSMREYSTYLIVQVLECEGDELSLWDTCHREIKPCFVVISFSVGLCIPTDPQIITVFLEASLGSC